MFIELNILHVNSVMMLNLKAWFVCIKRIDWHVLDSSSALDHSPELA